MRILIVNKFYYGRGGDCIAAMALERLLADMGHQTAVFAMKYPQNIKSEWDKYFPENVNFSSAGLTGKIKAVVRLFSSQDVVRKFDSLLSDFQPDVVHLHNIHSYLSPVVAQIAHKQGIRVVWTLHDYKLICPSYNCLRKGKPCELCYTDKKQVVKYRCMKNSLTASFLAYLEAVYWNSRKLERVADCFISPSNFLKNKMIAGGFSAKKIEVLHNFVDNKAFALSAKNDYYCYAGRISEEKGIDTLLKTAARLPFNLKIIGGGELLNAYKEQYNSFSHIEFKGSMSPQELFPLVAKSRFLVIPSVWYENNPLSVLEALCLGTPVLGADIGGIPELINEGFNGELFVPGDTDSLESKIEQMMEISFDYTEIATKAQTDFSANSFYERLIGIYKKDNIKP